MVNVRYPNYKKTYEEIQNLKFVLENLDKLDDSISNQVPIVAEEYFFSKKQFINWLEEIEFTLQDYHKNIYHDSM